jgi:hypothetical protein
VPEKGKNLPVIDGDVRVVNSDLGSELSSKPPDFEAFLCLFLAFDSFWNRLEVIWVSFDNLLFFVI